MTTPPTSQRLQRVGFFMREIDCSVFEIDAAMRDLNIRPIKTSDGYELFPVARLENLRRHLKLQIEPEPNLETEK
jgi:hypothetical protein